MPINRVLKAFDAIPVRLKRANYLKMRFRKLDRGIIDILALEEYNGS